jgi:hypothetical protein
MLFASLKKSKELMLRQRAFTLAERLHRPRKFRNYSVSRGSNCKKTLQEIASDTNDLTHRKLFCVQKLYTFTRFFRDQNFLSH